MTYQNYFQSSVVNSEDNYDIQVLKIKIAIKNEQVKANYEYQDSLGGYIQTGKGKKHYTSNLTNHTGNANHKEIVRQALIVQGKNTFEPIGKAQSLSFFNYHIISNDMEVND